MSESDLPDTIEDMRPHLARWTVYHDMRGRYLREMTHVFGLCMVAIASLTATVLFSSPSIASEWLFALSNFATVSYLGFLIFAFRHSVRRHDDLAFAYRRLDATLSNEAFAERLASVQASLSGMARRELPEMRAVSALAHNKVSVIFGETDTLEIPTLHRWFAHFLPFRSAVYERAG